MRKLLLFISLFFLVSCEREIIDGIQSIDSLDDMLEMYGCSFGNDWIDIIGYNSRFTFKAKQSGTLSFYWICCDPYGYKYEADGFHVRIDGIQVYKGFGSGTNVVLSVKKGDKISFFNNYNIIRVYFLKITNEKNSNTNNDDNQDFDF